MLFFIGLLIFLLLILLFLLFPKAVFAPITLHGQIRPADKSQIKDLWRKVKELAGQGKGSALQRSVVEANKVVDLALKKLYPQEEKMAERLKLAKELLKDKEIYDGLWYAHKMRNAIVHEPDFEVTASLAKEIVKKVEKGLEELGVLKEV